VDEVCRAIEWVDDPEVVGVLCDGLATECQAGLLAQKTVGWIGCREDLDDCSLAGLVHLCDEIVLILARDSESLDVEAGTVDDGAGTTCGFHRIVEHRVHDSRL
jgi:hypothetical protein